MADAKLLAKEKLESSGLTLEDAKKLHITAHASAIKLCSSYPDTPALSFAYMNPKTGAPAEFKPGWGPYSRVRVLGGKTGFDAQTDAKALRYLQPANSGIMVYYPSNVNWKSILADVEQPIIVTEGELKAAKASKEGFPCLGLGGVNSFQSARYGIEWLNDLDHVVWVKRVVFICYDSDTSTNENVCRALNSLAEMLQDRGALPHVLPLPDVVEGGKTGLDDYLLVKSAAEFQQHMNENAKALGVAKPLLEMNKTFVYIRNPGIVIDRETDTKMKPQAFTDHAHATLKYYDQVLRPDGSVSMRPVSAARTWLTWPLRVEAQNLTYAPGREQLITDKGPKHTAWNTWPGWGCKPKKGSVKLFLELLDNLFLGADPASKKWFLQWLAYPIQNPGVKLFTNAMIWGVKQGTGKSLIGYTMGRIYGKNFTELSQKDLYGDFNEWAENKQFVMGDEVTGSDKRHDSDALKKLVTQKEIRLNIKHVASFPIPDCINYYFTSNRSTAMFMDDGDRRSFIHETTSPPLSDAFYKAYDAWFQSDAGAGAIYHYMLHEVDCTGFVPAAAAMRTEAKERMIKDSKSEFEAWVATLKSDPAAILGASPFDLFTHKELRSMYDPDDNFKITSQKVKQNLRDAEFKQVHKGAAIKHNGYPEEFFIVRNTEKWEGAPLSEIHAHLKGQSAKEKRAKF
jgi:hypothetical protein